MLHITPAARGDYDRVRNFYYDLTDALADSEFTPGWIRDVYPTQEFLLHSIDCGELFLGELDGQLVSCMVVNHEYNEGYRGSRWGVEAGDEQILVIHALGVHAQHAGKGLAKQMVRHVIDRAREAGMKAIRLDVLGGNLPAEKAYTKVGFVYRATLPMFYDDTGWTDYKLFEYVL